MADEPASPSGQLARQTGYVDATHSERSEYVKHLKDYGQETIKSLILLNGGAIVALLTFVGALLAKGELAQLRLAAVTLDRLLPAFGCFGAGLATSVAAAGFGYLNFSALAEIAPSPRELHDWMSGVAVPACPKWLRTAPRWTAYAACAAAGGSFLLFLVGAWIVVDSAFVALIRQAWIEGAPKFFPRP